MAVRLLSCYDDEPYFDGESYYHEIPDSKVGSLFRFNRRRNVIYTAEPGDIDLEGEEYMKVLIYIQVRCRSYLNWCKKVGIVIEGFLLLSKLMNMKLELLEQKWQF